jgi:hypothetical protein
MWPFHRPRHRRGSERAGPRGFGDADWPAGGRCDFCNGPLLQLWLCARNGSNIATRYAGMPGLGDWDGAPLGTAGSWPLPKLEDVHKFCSQPHMERWQRRAGWL